MTKRVTKNQRGVALIIVIFAVMLFAMLGWTLTNMFSVDMEANLRNLESERAFYLADAGAQEAIKLLAAGDALFDSDSDTLTRTLNFGQYYVTRSAVGSTVTIVSSGYIPQISNYRAMRQVKILAEFSGGTGNIDKTIGCGGLFDWTAAKAAYTVDIQGDISATNYSGDGDATYNEVGVDYKPTATILPPTSGARAIGDGHMIIPMQWYHDNADCEWPSPGTLTITNTAADTSTSNILRVTAPANFFTGMLGQAVRNVDHPVLASGAWADADWAVITTVTSGTEVRLDKTINNDWDGHRIRLVRRYSATAPAPAAPESGDNDSGAGSGINYIGADIAHAMGYPVDVVIDLRSNSWSVQDVKIICEGDIFIKGANKLEMAHSSSGGSGTRMHPPLATREGNIICLDATTANNRVISGLIFSETGTVNWNYIKHPTSGASWLRGNMIYGQNIILDGDITLEWLTAFDPPDEAEFGVPTGSGISNITWQEQ